VAAPARSSHFAKSWKCYLEYIVRALWNAIPYAVLEAWVSGTEVGSVLCTKSGCGIILSTHCRWMCFRQLDHESLRMAERETLHGASVAS
jgi:hypothetical protein